jgi:hypothetical protein
MLRPQSTGGRLTTGAADSLGGGSGSRLRQIGLRVQRLRESVGRRECHKRHRCLERALAYFLAELLDTIGAAPSAIDLILKCSLVPPGCFATVANQFRPSSLDVGDTQ